MLNLSDCSLLSCKCQLSHNAVREALLAATRPHKKAGNSEIAEQRREIREEERAAIAQISQTLRQALEKAQIDAKTRNPMPTKPRRRKKCRLLVTTIKPHSIKSVRKLSRLSLRPDNSTLFLIRRELRKEVLSRSFDQIAA
jgi:hypothetical protein